MFRTELRGGFYRALSAQHTILSLPEGARLWLEPEPTNKFDPNAIQVWNLPPDGPRDEAEHFLGYIAKEDCEDIRGYIDDEDPEHTSYACKVETPAGLKPLLLIGFIEEFPEFEAKANEKDGAA